MSCRRLLPAGIEQKLFSFARYIEQYQKKAHDYNGSPVETI